MMLAGIVSPVSAQDFAGSGRAVDGDSLFVDGREVRLYGIDAPEYRQSCRVGWNNWSCGVDAASALRTLVDTRQLTCTPRDRDVYGRTVATCRIGDMDLAAAMLEKGFAIALDNAPAGYVAIAERSRSTKIGIWASEFVAPASYRAANPRSSATAAVSRTIISTTRVTVPAKVAGSAFRNCAEARATGAAPVRRGQPGYGAHLDGDGDGIACEPYRRR